MPHYVASVLGQHCLPREQYRWSLMGHYVASDQGLHCLPREQYLFAKGVV